MSEPNLPEESVAAKFASIERRLSNIERNGSLISASINDVSGASIIKTGFFSDTEAYGIRIQDPGSVSPQFEVGTDGYKWPYVMGDAFDPSASKSVTGGSFATTWRWQGASISHLGVHFLCLYTCPASTTGELRLSSNFSTTTSAYTMAVTTEYAPFRWLHGGSIGAAPYVIDIQARRTSGAGTILVYVPIGYQASPVGCSTTGLFT